MFQSVLQKRVIDYEGRTSLFEKEDELDEELLIKVWTLGGVQGKRKEIFILEEESHQFNYSLRDCSCCRRN